MDKFHALLLIIARVESLSDKKSKVVGSFNLRFFGALAFGVKTKRWGGPWGPFVWCLYLF